MIQVISDRRLQRSARPHRDLPFGGIDEIVQLDQIDAVHPQPACVVMVLDPASPLALGVMLVLLTWYVHGIPVKLAVTVPAPFMVKIRGLLVEDPDARPVQLTNCDPAFGTAVNVTCDPAL